MPSTVLDHDLGRRIADREVVDQIAIFLAERLLQPVELDLRLFGLGEPLRHERPCLRAFSIDSRRFGVLEDFGETGRALSRFAIMSL